MSKQFITNLLGPFSEAFTEILYGCETQHSGCEGVELVGKLQEQMHARSCESVFVSRPSTPEVDILVNHYHMEPL